MASSCRLQVRALFVGAGELQALAIHDPRVSGQDLNGYRFYGKDEAIFCCCVAVSAAPAGAALLESLVDNRLLRRLNEVEERMHESVAWMVELPD